MWNDTYAVPNTMVMLVILAYTFAMPRLKSRRNRVFLELLVLQTLAPVCGLAFTRAALSNPETPGAGVYLLCALSVMVSLSRSWWFLRFTVQVLHLDPVPRQTRMAWTGFGLAQILMVCLMEAVTAGLLPEYLWAVPHGLECLCAMESLRLIRGHSGLLHRSEYFSAVFCQHMLLAGNLARIFHATRPLGETFCLMGGILLFLSFENPLLYLSNRGSAFNGRAFREALRERQKAYRILSFAILDYIDTRGIYGGRQMDRGMALIGRYLVDTFPECQAFYLRSGRFALLGSQSMDWERIRTDIYDRFQSPWAADQAELDLNIAFVEIGEESDLATADGILNRLYMAFDNTKGLLPDTGGLIESDSILEMGRQVDVKRALERAVERNEVEIFLQPLIDGRTRTLSGAEVLCRIRDEEGRILPPSLFVPIAERTGYINLMGEQILEKACQFVRDHDLKAMGLSWLNVNLSPIQCMRKDLSQRFLTILDQYGIPAEVIHLEITEQAVLDISLLEQQIRILRENGFLFSLDDYGSGYSNLTRVKQYPFVNIKLDMEVVWSYFHDRDILLPTVVRAFKEMDYTVTAEGIETEEMADALCDLGADYLQGYYFSKPLAIDDFVKKYAHAGG